MRSLTSIVAVNRDGVIGRRNGLPWRLRSDMRFFREQTLDNVVIMGRKTFDSFGRGALPRRYNIIISSHFALFPEDSDCRTATGVEDSLFRATLAPRIYKDSFVIGGATIYEQFAPFVDRYLITLVEKEVSDGDTFFNQEPLGDPDAWEIRPLLSCPASEADEAEFTIFEVLARNPELFRERRELAIERARIAASEAGATRSRSRGPKSAAGDDASPSLF
jgi:dihydrofolate reductase